MRKDLSVAAAIAVVSLVLVLYFAMQDGPPAPSEAVFSGALTILSSEYKLGESVFMHVRDLTSDQRGDIQVYTPGGKLYMTIPFDGSIKSEFSQYFYPTTSARAEVCKVSELVGNWTVRWDPPYYPGLQFEMTSEWVGPEDQITDDC